MKNTASILSKILNKTEYLDALVLARDSGLITTDTHGLIVKLNAHATNLLGYAEKELLGNHINILSAEAPEQNKKSKSIKTLFSRGLIKNPQAELKKKMDLFFMLKSVRLF